MFNSLANVFAAIPGLAPTSALEVHPGQLARWLDELWARGPGVIPAPPPLGAPVPFLGNPGLGFPTVVAALAAPAAPVAFADPSGINAADPTQYTGLAGPFPVQPLWHHLIYAYLLENAGVVEIFSEVIRRATQGETMGISNTAALRWVRATEELFFREPSLFSVTSVTSQLRPEARVVRRNAYWRMFGMDLSHPIGGRGTAAGGVQEWKQHALGVVNSTFREKWAELLRQTWLGYENRTNLVGTNATDEAYVLMLCDSLRDMLNMRRQGGLLSREEFASVAVMSWFELTLSADTPIVVALQAQATTPEDRLALVAQRVGMAPAPRSRELFRLAPLISPVLRIIETGVINTGPLAATLYTPGTALATAMNDIVDLWQSATGERVKDRPAGNVATPAAAQPLRIPGAQPLAGPRLVAGGTGGRP